MHIHKHERPTHYIHTKSKTNQKVEDLIFSPKLKLTAPETVDVTSAPVLSYESPLLGLASWGGSCLSPEADEFYCGNR